MSHVTVLKGITFRDVNAIRSAVQELANSGVNISLTENCKPRVHGFDRAPTCELVVKLPGCQYDLGLRKTEDGSYEPVFDTYMNQVGSQLAAACPVPSEYERRAIHQFGRFGQAYQKHAAINQCAAEGYAIDSITVDEDNTVHIVANVSY